MKRLLGFFIILLVVSSLYAADRTYSYKNPLTKSFSLQAGYGNVVFVSLQPIASQSQGYIMGMPFSIEDSLVQKDYKLDGRQIAVWSMLSNTPYTIKATATDLVWEENIYYTNPSVTSLPYALIFNYRIAYYPKNSYEIAYDFGSFRVKSESNTVTYEDGIDTYSSGIEFSISNDNVDFSYYVGSLEGIVFFKFCEGADIANAPGGDYHATLTLEVTSI